MFLNKLTLPFNVYVKYSSFEPFYCNMIIMIDRKSQYVLLEYQTPLGNSAVLTNPEYSTAMERLNSCTYEDTDRCALGSLTGMA